MTENKPLSAAQRYANRRKFQDWNTSQYTRQIDPVPRNTEQEQARRIRQREKQNAR